MTPAEEQKLRKLMMMKALREQVGKPEPKSSVMETIADTGVGVVQGATMNFADEIGGAAEALVDKAGAVLSGEESDLGELYEKNRDEYRARQKLAEERSPIASTVGEVLGGVGTGILTAGGGAAVSGGQAALKASKLARLAKGIGVGAATGAATGAGQAKEMSDIPEEMYEGAKMGSIVGAVIGPLADAGGYVAGKLKSKVGGVISDFLESPGAAQAKIAFEKGKSGDTMTTAPAKMAKTAEMESKRVSELVQKVDKVDTQFGDKIGSLIKKSDSEGTLVSPMATDADDIAMMAEKVELSPSTLGKARTVKTQELLNKFSTGQLKPTEAFELRKQILELTEKSKDDDLIAIGKRLQSNLKSDLDEQVPGLKEASANFRQFREAVPEPIMGRGKAGSEFSSKWYGDVGDKQAKLAESIQNLLEGLRSPGKNPIERSKVLNTIKQRLSDLEKKAPGTLKELGYDSVEDLERDIIKRSDEVVLPRVMLGTNPQAGVATEVKSALTGEMGTTLRGLAYGTAQTAGRGARVLGDLVKPLTKEVAPTVGKVTEAVSKASSSTANLSRNLFNTGDEKLRIIGQKMAQNPETRMLGESLLGALENKSGSAKNAALFIMMQNPNIRKMFDGDTE